MTKLPAALVALFLSVGAFANTEVVLSQKHAYKYQFLGAKYAIQNDGSVAAKITWRDYSFCSPWDGTRTDPSVRPCRYTATEVVPVPGLRYADEEITFAAPGSSSPVVCARTQWVKKFFKWRKVLVGTGNCYFSETNTWDRGVKLESAVFNVVN